MGEYSNDTAKYSEYTPEFIEAVDKIIKDGGDGWGHNRTIRFKETIVKICDFYAKLFDYTPLQVLLALERERTYTYPNYYQDSNFPTDPKEFTVYENKDAVYEAFQPKEGFRCSGCKGVSKDPYACTCAGCDWKTYGLLKFDLFKFTIKENWILKPIIDEVFLPIALEKKKPKKRKKKGGTKNADT